MNNLDNLDYNIMNIDIDDIDIVNINVRVPKRYIRDFQNPIEFYTEIQFKKDTISTKTPFRTLFCQLLRYQYKLPPVIQSKDIFTTE